MILTSPSIGDSENANGRTLAYGHLDSNKGFFHEDLSNADLVPLALACTTLSPSATAGSSGRRQRLSSGTQGCEMYA
jgi:hypothetical protein